MFWRPELSLDFLTPKVEVIVMPALPSFTILQKSKTQVPAGRSEPVEEVLPGPAQCQGHAGRPWHGLTFLVSLTCSSGPSLSPVIVCPSAPVRLSPCLVLFFMQGCQSCRIKPLPQA